MPVETSLLKPEGGFKDLIDNIIYKIKFRKEHPYFFAPSGTVVFIGGQGSGKSLSAYLYVDRLLKKYPKCILVTNLILKDYPLDHVRIFPFKDNDDLLKYKNGEYGVIYFIDEIQIYLNSLQSKNLNMEVMGQLAQQRKQRVHIVSTSQRIGRTAKQLREQYPCLVKCTNLFNLGLLQKLEYMRDADIDDSGHVEGKIDKKVFYFHSPRFYDKYDTYAILEKGKFANGEEMIKHAD